MEVRLDVWHFMRRMGRGCYGESHPLFGIFQSRLSNCIFEWDTEDYELLITAKRAVLVGEGISNPSTGTVTKSITRKELARHCRRRTRGVQETTRLVEELLLSLAVATDSIGVPLLKEEMKEIWAEQSQHIKCLHECTTVRYHEPSEEGRCDTAHIQVC